VEVTHQGIKFDVFRFPGSQLPAGKILSSLIILYIYSLGKFALIFGLINKGV
jgi:hypothetical protein